MLISFTKPGYLLFLIVIPLFIFIHFYTLRSKKKKALKFANFDAISRVHGIEIYSKNIVILVLSIVIVSLLVLSMSGLMLHVQKRASSFSFVIAVDTSRSMSANDISPTRIDAAKSIAKDFIDDTPSSTKIGIVSFSGTTYIERDLTSDKTSVKSAVGDIEISGVEGTDVYEAVITSTNLLRNEDSRSIIILSDGQLNVGRVKDTIDYANDNDVLINTIAVGTEEGGKTDYGVSKVDEDALKGLAYSTNGKFFRAVDRASLAQAFQEVMEVTRKNVALDLSGYLLGAAVLIFVLEYFLMNTRYRVLP